MGCWRCAGGSFATVAAVVLLARGRANATTRLPFGSYLAVGGLAACGTCWVLDFRGVGTAHVVSA